MSHLYQQLKYLLYVRNAKLWKQTLLSNSKIILLEEHSDCYYAAHSIMFIIIFILIRLFSDWLCRFFLHLITKFENQVGLLHYCFCCCQLYESEIRNATDLAVKIQIRRIFCTSVTSLHEVTKSILQLFIEIKHLLTNLITGDGSDLLALKDILH